MTTEPRRDRRFASSGANREAERTAGRVWRRHCDSEHSVPRWSTRRTGSSVRSVGSCRTTTCRWPLLTDLFPGTRSRVLNDSRDAVRRRHRPRPLLERECATYFDSDGGRRRGREAALPSALATDQRVSTARHEARRSLASGFLTSQVSFAYCVSTLRSPVGLLASRETKLSDEKRADLLRAAWLGRQSLACSSRQKPTAGEGTPSSQHVILPIHALLDRVARACSPLFAAATPRRRSARRPSNAGHYESNRRSAWRSAYRRLARSGADCRIDCSGFTHCDWLLASST